MKPTEKEIEAFAHEDLSKEAGSPFTAYIKGYRKAISQMQPEWVSISQKESCLKEGDKAWIEMDYSEWGRNEKRIEIADVHFAKEPRGYGGPNALTGSGMLTGVYFSLPAIVNPASVKRFCLIPQPPTT